MEVLHSCVVNEAIFLLVLLLPCGTSAQRYLSYTEVVGDLQDSLKVLC